MLYNEERPYRFDDVVGQKMIVENVRNQSKINKFFQVYVLGGQYGAGKTTLARIIALAANCNHKDENGNPCLECEACRSILAGNCIDVVEIDGASNNGVDQVRELTANTAYVPALLKYKVIIIDEVHMLSKAAFNAFLKTLEEPPEYCIFILCTTEVNAIPATVRSRSANYNFKRISTEDIYCHLKQVAEKYGIQLDTDAGKLIAKNAGGAMRNALALLEQCMMVSKHVTADIIKNLLGVESIDSCFSLLTALLTGDTVETIKIAETFFASGRNMYIILGDMLEIMADSIMYLSGAEKSIVNTEDYISSVKMLADLTTLDELFSLSRMLSDLKSDIKTDDSSVIIISFIKMTKHLTLDYNALLGRISALEKELKELKENGCIMNTDASFNIVKSEITDISEKANDASIHIEDPIADDISVEENIAESTSAEEITANSAVSDMELYDTAAFEYYAEMARDENETLMNSEIPEDTSDVSEDMSAKTVEMETDEFDYMSLFQLSGNSPSSPQEMETKKKTIINKSDSVEDNEKALAALATLKSDIAIAAAVDKNCKAVNNPIGGIILYTAHAPVQKIVQAYINAKCMEGITVVLDAKKALQ